MKHTTRIISGIVLLALGIGWVLELTGLIHVDLYGWWTLLIIIPCFVSIFDSKHKAMPLIGFGVGILLLLASRDIIAWNDIWEYILCLVAVVWGLSLIFTRKNSHCVVGQADCRAVEEMKQIDQEGRQIHKINVSFGKQLYEFDGRRFEGADVQTSFGFTALDLRNADLLDGAVVKVECSFGGMEIRVDKDVCVKSLIEASFGSVENRCASQPTVGGKTLYIKGECSFGGIEIR